MTTDALTIENVTKRRGARTVVDRVSLSIAPGERVALLGHNGAGKSTLIKMALGLLSLDGGSIHIGSDVPGSALARASTAFVPEAISFHPAVTGREQLRLFARLSRLAPDLDAILERVGLSDAADNRIKTYSKGMRQRLGLAQVLLGQPRLALLDEPTSGLDPVSRVDLYRIIDELAAQGTGVLIASHALTEVEARTDRIAILRGGVLAAHDSLEALSRSAGLLTRLQLRAGGDAKALATRLGGRLLSDSLIEITCDATSKMQKIRQVAALGDAVSDLEILPPRLEDLYLHYSGEKIR